MNTSVDTSHSSYAWLAALDTSHSSYAWLAALERLMPCMPKHEAT